MPTITLERVKGMVELRDCVRELIDYQLHDFPDHAIKSKQAELNRLYDNFSRKFGLISDNANNKAFAADSAYYLLCSLEVIDENGKLERKSDMFTKRTIKQKIDITSVDTSAEALAVSIAKRAKVDMEYMNSANGVRPLMKRLGDVAARTGCAILLVGHLNKGKGRSTYHLRQSFKPGEIDAETAGRVAWETVMSLTKGRHAFVIAVHIDKAHVHAHTVFNSTSLDCSRKWRNFKRSGLALQKISDTICLSHGLSIIENPQAKSKSYDKWLGNNKPLGNREQLAYAIDSVLPKCKSWEDFIAELKSLGCGVKQGAHIAVKLPDAKRFARLSSLPAGYDENSIRARLSGEIKFEPLPLRETGAKVPKLLIDIQQKMSDGYSKGFENWAELVNLKRSAKTLIYIKDSGIDSYEELEQKCSVACGKATVLRNKINDIETQQKENREFQQQISNYGRTREIYIQYKASGWDVDFYEQFRADIMRHKAAKKYFDERGLKKLPSIKTLQAEWGELEKQKRPLYSEYKTANQKFKDLCTAKSNASRMLGLDKKRDSSRVHGIEI